MMLALSVAFITSSHPLTLSIKSTALFNSTSPTLTTSHTTLFVADGLEKEVGVADRGNALMDIHCKGVSHYCFLLSTSSFSLGNSTRGNDLGPRLPKVSPDDIGEKEGTTLQPLLLLFA